MGRDKCLLQIDGVPLWKRQLSLLERVSDDVMVAAPKRPEWLPSGNRWVADASEGAGPMAGLAGAFRRANHPHVFVLAVDMPAIPPFLPKVLGSIATSNRGVVPMLQDRFEPLAALYPKSALRLVEGFLQQGNLALQPLARQLADDGTIQPLPMPDSAVYLFHNLNRPTDYLNYAASCA